MTTPTAATRKLGAGLYSTIIDGTDYFVGRSGTGQWRWASDTHVGPWVATKREADAGLAAHLAAQAAATRDCFVCGGAAFLTGVTGPCPACVGTGQLAVPAPRPRAESLCVQCLAYTAGARCGECGSYCLTQDLT